MRVAREFSPRRKAGHGVFGSSPEITLVVFNPMAVKKSAEFLLEGFVTMVFPLVRDVLDYL